MSNLDLGATATTGPNFRMDELHKARGVYHEDFLNEGPDKTHEPKALADKAEAKLYQIASDTEHLQHGAPVEDEVQIPALHDDVAELQLTEVRETGSAREAGRAGELPEAEEEFGEAGHA
jgi:hypothetical protein